MKLKKIIALVTAIPLALASFVPAFATNVAVDGQQLQFTQSSGVPFIDAGNRTQVPLRLTMETCGLEVSWNQETQTASVKNGEITVQVPIGESYIIKNGRKIPNDTAAIIKDSRTYLPIRAVLEAFGAGVGWIPQSETVTVSTLGIMDKDYNDQVGNITIEKDDRSFIYNDYLHVSMFYEKVQLPETSAANIKINQTIRQECSSFFGESSEIMDDIMNYPPDPQYGDAHYSNAVESRVTNNSDGALSIRTELFWHMGGVANIIPMGYNFDLVTGEQLRIDRFFSTTSEQTLEYLKNCIITYMAQNPGYGWVDNAVSTVEGYTLDDINYYIEGDTAVVIIGQYELAPGAAGSHEIVCEIV